MSPLWLIPPLILAVASTIWWLVLARIDRARRDLAVHLAALAPVREATTGVGTARRHAHDGLEALEHR